MIKIKVSAIDDIPTVIDLPKSKNIILDIDTYVGVTTDTKISEKRTVLEDVLASIWYNVIINHHDDTMLEELLGITYQFFKSEKNIHIFFIERQQKSLVIIAGIFSTRFDSPDNFSFTPGVYYQLFIQTNRLNRGSLDVLRNLQKVACLDRF